jgi:hypothetical protein
MRFAETGIADDTKTTEAAASKDARTRETRLNIISSLPVVGIYLIQTVDSFLRFFMFDRI